MTKIVGQALWVIEHGAARIDQYAPWALRTVFDHLQQGRVCLEAHPDGLFGEKIKAEALIGPPPVPEPLLTYAKWYRDRLHQLEERSAEILLAHEVVSFELPDGSHRKYLFDLSADVVTDPDTGHEQTRVLWIDVARSVPAGVLVSLVTSLVPIRRR